MINNGVGELHTRRSKETQHYNRAYSGLTDPAPEDQYHSKLGGRTGRKGVSDGSLT